MKACQNPKDQKISLTLICLNGGRRGVDENDPPCGFSKNVSSKGRVKPWFFATFNIISKHNSPENLIEFPQVVQKILRKSPSILAFFINFPQFSGFFWHYLVTKKLMVSAYNRWCQHTLNRLFNNYIKLYWY